MTVEELAPSLADFVRAALGRKATDLLVLDVSALTSFADVFMLCSGKSNRQVTAIAEHIRRDLKDKGISPISVEGMSEGHWVLMDYGHILVHVFLEPVREFYDLEGFWANAERIPVDGFVQDAEKDKEDGAIDA